VQTVGDLPVGTLVADITGEAGEVRRALESLRSAGVIVEENEA
jgi:hypothetical protein